MWMEKQVFSGLKVYDVLEREWVHYLKRTLGYLVKKKTHIEIIVETF